MTVDEIRRLSGKELCSLRVAVVKEEMRREPTQKKAFYAAFRRCMADDIVKIRESKGWTVHKAATEAGITGKTLRLVERGERTASMETCYKLEKVYGREFFMRAMEEGSKAGSDAGVLA